METVFEEFVRHPILSAIERGRPLIKTGKTAIISNTINVNIVRKKKEHKIEFMLLGSIFRNKLLSNSDIKKREDTLKINDKQSLRLDNITADRVGTVLAIWYVIEWLDGLPVEVTYADYIPKCANCVLNSENIKKYYKLYDLAVRNYVESQEGCICNQPEFEEGDGCEKLFIRNTYPDLGEVGKIIKDFL